MKDEIFQLLEYESAKPANQHIKSLPILKEDYQTIIKNIIDDLGIYAKDFGENIRGSYFNKISKLKLNENIESVISELSDLIPELRFISSSKAKISKTISLIVEKEAFKNLSTRDQQVLLTATLLENCSKISSNESAFDASIIARRLGFTQNEVKKIANIVKNANLIQDFMKINRENVSINTPVGEILEGNSRELILDKMALSLKEGNTFELAKLLYSTKEQDGLSRNLDKIIQNRINEIKANDFVLPQFSIRNWVDKMSKDPKWLKTHTDANGRIMIERDELPKEYHGFIHCIDYTAATGGQSSTNIANFDLFSIPNDKIICSSYISKDMDATFGNLGLLLQAKNEGQLVGTGHDIFSFGKDIDGILLEYYRDKGLLANSGKGLKFKHRTSISDSLKEILYGVNYENLYNERQIKIQQIYDRFTPQIEKLNNERKSLIESLSKKLYGKTDITTSEYIQLKKKYPKIQELETNISILENKCNNEISQLEENKMIEKINNEYIKRIDKLKESENPITLEDIKNIDVELYNAYVEYLSRTTTDRLSENALLSKKYHNEVLLNEVNVDAYMIKVERGTSIYDFHANVPEEFFNRAQNEHIPIITWYK